MVKHITSEGPQVPLKFPITALGLIIPDLSLAKWNIRGELALEDLLVGPTVKTFRTLQIEYDIPSSDYYKYTQISHLLEKKSNELITRLPWQIALFLTNKSTKLKGTALFYKHLQNKNSFNKTSNIVAWEKDFKRVYTDDQWIKALKITYVSTRSANLWELHHKFLLRWYLTPYRISKFIPGASPECWRKCGGTGSLLHVLWSCPRIQRFWMITFQLVEQITGIKVDFSPGMALLSLEIDSIPPSLRILVSHIFIAARLTIVRHWKDTNPPSVTETLQLIDTHRMYEIQFAWSLGNQNKITNIWVPWTIWYPQNMGLRFFEK